MDGRELMEAARTAAEKAYAPYSDFQVGAALLTEGGEMHTGCNIENASYGLTVCAERNAIAAMVLENRNDRQIRRVAITSPKASPCFPCGACRQVLREFGCREILVEENGELKKYAFDREILPHSFGPEDL